MEDEKSSLIVHLQGKQIFLCELQIIIIAKPPENSPGGLVSPSLYKESVQEEEACIEQPAMEA